MVYSCVQRRLLGPCFVFSHFIPFFFSSFADDEQSFHCTFASACARSAVFLDYDRLHEQHGSMQRVWNEQLSADLPKWHMQGDSSVYSIERSRFIRFDGE